MSKLIIGITGLMAAGKGTSASYLKEKHNASTYTFSSMLGDALDRFYLEKNRDNYIKISEIMRGTFGEDIMAKTMAEDVRNDTNNLIVVEGVRRDADIDYLSKMDGFVLVEIFADIETRFERLKNRGEKSDDATKTFEGFKADHERSTELSTVEVAEQASLRIDNNGTMEELCGQLDELVLEMKK
jgi:dephospho-CoA kinase